MNRPDMSARRKGKGFKKGIDQDEARRKREDNIIELRKNKRDENLLKRRTIINSDAPAQMSSSSNNNQSMQQKVMMCSLCWTRMPASDCQGAVYMFAWETEGLELTFNAYPSLRLSCHSWRASPLWWLVCSKRIPRFS
jgi:hypothetical protein